MTTESTPPIGTVRLAQELGDKAAAHPPARTATARRTKSNHPVIIATGEKSLDQLDFELPGPIELEWRRQYRSGDARSDGWFGQGWTHPLATELWLEPAALSGVLAFSGSTLAGSNPAASATPKSGPAVELGL